MKNAIDINDFLSKDYQKSLPLSSIQVIHSFDGSFQLKDGALIAQEHLRHRVGVFCVSLRDDDIILYDTNQGKQYLFRYSFKDQYIQMNQRRAQRNEVLFFLHRLNHLAQLLFRMEPLIGCASDKKNTVSPEGLSVELLQRLAPYFHVHLPLFWELMNYAHIEQLVQLFRVIISEQKRLLTTTDQAHQLNQMVGYFRGLVQDHLMESDACVCITNSFLVVPSLNRVYLLYLYPDQVIYTIKTGNERIEVKVSFDDGAILFNQAPIDSNALPWLAQEMAGISDDLAKQRSDVYVAPGTLP